MKYTTIKQKGEIGYGQPSYGITPTEGELTEIKAGNMEKVISTRTYKQTCKCVETGEVAKSVYVLKYSIRYNSDCNEWMCHINCYHDVAALANYFGDRMDASFFERYKAILVVLP